LKAHISEERYHRSEGVEIVPLQEKSGTRIYVMARPYILEPDYTLTVGMYPRPTEQGAIGEVLATDWVGMKERVVGQGQAWLYTQECTLVLWECFLDDWYRKEDPRTDETLRALWTGFEGFLLKKLTGVERIATLHGSRCMITTKTHGPNYCSRSDTRALAPRHLVEKYHRVLPNPGRRSLAVSPSQNTAIL
jgi:hypothetical protein